MFGPHTFYNKTLKFSLKRLIIPTTRKKRTITLSIRKRRHFRLNIKRLYFINIYIDINVMYKTLV